MTKTAMTQCRNCGAWHLPPPSPSRASGGDFCEFCLRKGRSDWTVRTNRVRKPKWWR